MATADRLLDPGLLHTAAVTVPLSSLVWHPPLRIQTEISALWFPFNLLKTPSLSESLVQKSLRLDCLSPLFLDLSFHSFRARADSPSSS